MDKAAVLIFAYGNLSRGDDALAPLLLEQLQQQQIQSCCGHPIKYLSDYQLQVEHVMDMQGCQRILLIDADVSLNKPFKFYPVLENKETHYTTHGMSPSTLLYTYRQVHQQSAPLTYMLAIRGISFELGQGLSEQASTHLKLASEFIYSILNKTDFSCWDEPLIKKPGH